MTKDMIANFILYLILNVLHYTLFKKYLDLTLSVVTLTVSLGIGLLIRRFKCN